MTEKRLLGKLKKFANSHKIKVEKSIKDKKLYAECIDGHKHYLTSYEEYVFAMNENSILFVYGL